MRVFIVLLLIVLPVTAKRTALRLGIYDNPPHTFLANGQPRGFVVEVVVDFAAANGFAVQPVYGPFPELLAKLMRGEIDLLAPIAYARERSQHLRYTDESMVIDWSNVITSSGRQGSIRAVEDLEGKTLACVRADYYAEQFRALLERQQITIRLRGYDDFLQVEAAVENGDCDAGFVSHFSLLHILKTLKKTHVIRLMPGSFFPEPLYAAAPLARADLAARLDLYLKKAKADRQSLFNQAYERWFSESYSKPLRFIARNYLILLALVVAALLAFLGLNLLLSRKVRYLSSEMTQQKDFLKNLLQNIPAGIVILDERGMVVELNREFQRLFGYGIEELKGESLDARIVPPDQLEASRHLNSRIMAGDIIDEEVIRRTKDNESLHLHLIGSPIVLGKRVLGILGIYIDIAERKRMEAEIIRTQNIESVGVLAGGIAHDFNNMLTGILGNISLAIALSREEKTAAVLKRAEKATLMTKGLTQQLLTFSKGGTMHLQVVSSGEIVRDSIDLALSGSAIKPILQIDEPPPQVAADATQITQVLTNILINAKDAMPQGGEVGISVHRVNLEDNRLSLAKGEYVAIAIRDHGPGISPADLDKLFVPFYSSKKKGSGLGLAISYSIIKRHNGLITAVNHPQGGAVFTVFLPVSSEPEVRTEPIDSGRLRHVKVMLMDDEEMVRQVFQDMMEHTGLTIHAVANSTQALELFCKERDKGEPFDLVFLDLTVPGDIGGIKTLEKLLHIDPQLRAVAITGYSQAMFDPHELRHFRDLLAKPFRLEDLLAVISRNLQSQS